LSHTENLPVEGIFQHGHFEVIMECPRHQWRIQVASFGQLPSPNICAVPFKWRPSVINAPPLMPTQVETEIKQYSKINNILRLVQRQDFQMPDFTQPLVE